MTVSQQDLITPLPSLSHPREPLLQLFSQVFLRNHLSKVLKITSYAQRTFNAIHHVHLHLHLHRKVIHRERHKQGNCQSRTHITQLVLHFKFSHQRTTLPYLTLPNLIQVAEHFKIKTFSRSRSRFSILFLTWQELEGRLRVVFEGYGFLGWYLT